MPLLYTKLALTVSKVTIFIKNSYLNASCIFIKLIFLKRCVCVLEQSYIRLERTFSVDLENKAWFVYHRQVEMLLFYNL